MLSQEDEFASLARLSEEVREKRVRLERIDVPEARISLDSSPEAQPAAHLRGGGDMAVRDMPRAMSAGHILAVFDAAQEPTCRPSEVPHLVALRAAGFSDVTAAFEAAVRIRNLMETERAFAIVLVLGTDVLAPLEFSKTRNVVYRKTVGHSDQVEFEAWLVSEYPPPTREAAPRHWHIGVAVPSTSDDTEWGKSHEAEHDALRRGIRNNVMVVPE